MEGGEVMGPVMTSLNKFVDSRIGKRLALWAALPVMCGLTLFALYSVKTDRKGVK